MARVAVQPDWDALVLIHRECFGCLSETLWRMRFSRVWLSCCGWLRLIEESETTRHFYSVEAETAADQGEATSQLKRSPYLSASHMSESGEAVRFSWGPLIVGRMNNEPLGPPGSSWIGQPWMDPVGLIKALLIPIFDIFLLDKRFI